MRGTCPTCWRSHGCSLAAGHDGEHVCEPCPPDCDAPTDEDWAAGYMADQCGSCSVHCGDRPTEGDRLFDVTPELGSHNERTAGKSAGGFLSPRTLRQLAERN